MFRLVALGAPEHSPEVYSLLMHCKGVQRLDQLLTVGTLAGLWERYGLASPPRLTLFQFELPLFVNTSAVVCHYRADIYLLTARGAVDEFLLVLSLKDMLGKIFGILKGQVAL